MDVEERIRALEAKLASLEKLQSEPYRPNTQFKDGNEGSGVTTPQVPELALAFNTNTVLY
jgi:hypothetical protein